MYTSKALKDSSANKGRQMSLLVSLLSPSALDHNPQLMSCFFIISSRGRS